jgi:hypothetical protein
MTALLNRRNKLIKEVAEQVGIHTSGSNASEP